MGFLVVFLFVGFGFCWRILHLLGHEQKTEITKFYHLADWDLRFIKMKSSNKIRFLLFQFGLTVFPPPRQHNTFSFIQTALEMQ